MKEQLFLKLFLVFDTKILMLFIYFPWYNLHILMLTKPYLDSTNVILFFQMFTDIINIKNRISHAYRIKHMHMCL